MLTLNDLKKDDIKVGDTDIVVFIERLYADTARMYLKQHRDWYINERFVRGDHWVVYNKTLNKVQVLPVSTGEIRRTINKIGSQIRGVKNFIKRNQPRWEIHPEGDTKEDKEEARKKNKILQYIYRTRNIKFHLTGVVVNGLKYSAGILEGGIVKKEGKDIIDYWVDDTFEILFDPFATTVQSCRYIIKTFKKPLTSIKNNKDYTIKKGNEVKSDNKEAASQYKELLELEKYSRDGSSGSADLESTIGKELWMKWTDDIGKTKVRVFTIAGGQFVGLFEPKYRRYPMFVYNPEKDANSIYSNAWVKNLISINKSLNKTVSQIEGYIQRMLAGKYLIKQGVEVSSITDKGAEKIYYKGSVAPTQMNLQPLPAAPFSHVANSERWIEEGGGMREASLGRIPGSLQSGKAIEALQSADAATVAEPVENLEQFLKEVAEFTLELIEDNQVASEEIIEAGEKIKYIGKLAEGSEPPKNTVTIKAGEVSVRIVPEIAYSEDAKKDYIMRLAEAGVVDKQTVLEVFSISNISDILDRVKKQQEEEFKQEMVKQKESHRTSGEAPDDTASLADQENMQMAAGQQVPATPQALWAPEHTELHIAFIQQDKDAYQQNKELFDEHISSEEQYQQQ